MSDVKLRARVSLLGKVWKEIYASRIYDEGLIEVRRIYFPALDIDEINSSRNPSVAMSSVLQKFLHLFTQISPFRGIFFLGSSSSSFMPAE